MQNDYLILKLNRIIQRENWFNKSIDKETEKISFITNTYLSNKSKNKRKIKKDYETLKDFFLDLNTKYLGQVENFHINLSKILDMKIKEALKELQD